MTTIAILDESLPIQWRERPEELAPVEVVWAGTDRAALRVKLPALRPDVLALDLDLLGEDPLSEAQRLSTESGATLVLLLHRFAKRDVLREVARSGARPVRAPVRLSSLRTHMTSVIVRGLLETDETPRARPPALPPTVAQDTAEARSTTPARSTGRRFTRAQLARLAEIQSKIECECPNHISELLLALGSFEEYARGCENRNAADAKIHAMLAEQTGAARRVMEDALAELLVHEGITI